MAWKVPWDLLSYPYSKFLLLEQEVHAHCLGSFKSRESSQQISRCFWLFPTEYLSSTAISTTLTCTTHEKCQMLLLDLVPFLNGSCSVYSPAESMLLNKAQSNSTLAEQWPSSSYLGLLFIPHPVQTNYLSSLQPPPNYMAARGRIKKGEITSFAKAEGSASALPSNTACQTRPPAPQAAQACRSPAALSTYVWGQGSLHDGTLNDLEGARQWEVCFPSSLLQGPHPIPLAFINLSSSSKKLQGEWGINNSISKVFSSADPMSLPVFVQAESFSM